LIRQLYHFATDFDRVLLQLVNTDIVNTLFQYKVSLRHLTLMIETFKLPTKSCAKFDLLFLNIQWATACSLEKVNFNPSVAMVFFKTYVAIGGINDPPGVSRVLWHLELKIPKAIPITCGCI